MTGILFAAVFIALLVALSVPRMILRRRAARLAEPVPPVPAPAAPVRHGPSYVAVQPSMHAAVPYGGGGTHEEET